MALEFPDLNLAGYCAPPTPGPPAHSAISPALPVPFPSYLQARDALTIIREFVDKSEYVVRLFRPASVRQPIHELWEAADRLGRHCLAGGETRDTHDQVNARVRVVDALICRVLRLTCQEWAAVLGEYYNENNMADCSRRPLEWLALFTEAQYDRLAALDSHTSLRVTVRFSTKRDRDSRPVGQ